MPLTNDTAAALLNHVNGLAAFTVVGPARILLVNNLGSLPYATGELVNLTTATAGAKFATNSTNILFTNMPSEQQITSWRIVDSSATPQVLWTGTMLRVRLVPLGDSYEILPGDLRVELS